MSGLKIKFTGKHPGSYWNVTQKLAMGIWPWSTGARARLPHHYKVRYIEKHMKQPEAIHYRPDTRKHIQDKWGVVKPVQNVPIPLLFPKEAHEGLWGGEGFLLGLRRRKDQFKKPAVYRLWKPYLMKRTLYSEILDQWLDITITLRTLGKIDEAQGFDNYILKTHEVDLNSRLGMALKRMMLKTLHDKSMYPDDAKKQDTIYNKYKSYLVPPEEIEWLGLTIEQAERKQWTLDEEGYQASVKPLKETYMDELIEKMENMQTHGLESLEEYKSEEKHGILHKINPFKS